MLRIHRLILAGLSMAAFACGSSEDGKQTSAARLNGQDCNSPDGKCDDQLPPPGQPPTQPGACFNASLQGSLCLDASAWKQLASGACGASGAQLTSASFGPACPSNGAPKQPPPGMETDPGTGAGGASGTDGNKPTDPSVDPNTPTSDQDDPTRPNDYGTYSQVSFTCCVGTQPPQPPPQPCNGNDETATGSDRPCPPNPTPVPPPSERCTKTPLPSDVACVADGQTGGASLCPAGWTLRSISGCDNGQQDPNSGAIVECCASLAQPTDNGK